MRAASSPWVLAQHWSRALSRGWPSPTNLPKPSTARSPGQTPAGCGHWAARAPHCGLCSWGSGWGQAAAPGRADIQAFVAQLWMTLRLGSGAIDPDRREGLRYELLLCAGRVRPIVTLPPLYRGKRLRRLTQDTKLLTHPMGTHGSTHTCPRVHSRTVHVSTHTCGHLTRTCAANHTAHKDTHAHTCVPRTHRGALGVTVETYSHSGTQTVWGPQGPPGSGSVICWDLSLQPSWLRFLTANGAKQLRQRVQVQRKPGFRRPLPWTPGGHTDSSSRSSIRTRPGFTGAGHPVPVHSDGVYTPCPVLHIHTETYTRVCGCMHTYPVYTCAHQSPHTRAWGHGVCSDAMMSHNSVHSGVTLRRVRSAPEAEGSVPSPLRKQQPEPRAPVLLRAL